MTPLICRKAQIKFCESISIIEANIENPEIYPIEKVNQDQFNSVLKMDPITLQFVSSKWSKDT